MDIYIDIRYPHQYRDCLHFSVIRLTEATMLKIALLDAAANAHGEADIDGIGRRHAGVLNPSRTFYRGI